MGWWGSGTYTPITDGGRIRSLFLLASLLLSLLYSLHNPLPSCVIADGEAFTSASSLSASIPRRRQDRCSEFVIPCVQVPGTSGTHVSLHDSQVQDL